MVLEEIAACVAAGRLRAGDMRSRAPRSATDAPRSLRPIPLCLSVPKSVANEQTASKDVYNRFAGRAPAEVGQLKPLRHGLVDLNGTEMVFSTVSHTSSISTALEKDYRAKDGSSLCPDLNLIHYKVTDDLFYQCDAILSRWMSSSSWA